MTVIPLSHLQHVQKLFAKPTDSNIPFQEPSARDSYAVKKDIAIMKTLQKNGVEEEELLPQLSDRGCRK
ncbi:MAG: hypothetical protein AB2L14_29765 [Candidatus Xenobiia bacterium LiM19]